MKRLAFVACVAAVCMMAASTMATVVPTTSGSDYILTLDSGSDTCSTTLTGSGTLYKRGAGEVILNTSSSAFSGEVVVEAGTLTISNKTAVGSSAPIEVKSGATLWLKLPGTGQSSTVAFPHNVTIAGKGVGDNGAFRFTNTSSSSNGDNLLNKLILSDDATIDVSNRWGMYNYKVVELNGHTLTRIGKSNWMMFGVIQSTGGPGEVNNAYGTLTFQNAPVIQEGVTVVVTNIDSSSCIGLWGADMGSSKGTIKVYNGRYIQAQSGNAQTSNHIGPLHLAGNTSTVTLYPQYNSNARAMSVDGAVTSDSGVALCVDGKGSVWFNGAVTLPNTATVQGGGNVWFNNDVSVSGDMSVLGGGNLYLCGANSVRSIRLVLKGSTTTTHEAGRTSLGMLRVANGGTERAQFRQTGGVIGLPSDAPRIGETGVQRGHFTLEGGEFHASNTVYIAERAGSFGAFRQTGGFFESYYSGNRNNEATRLFIGRGGNAVFVQTGGTNDISHVGSKGDQKLRAVIGSTNGVAEATISGVGTEFRASGLLLGGTSAAPTTNILNLANGAKLKVNRFRKSSQMAASSLAVVNVDGGILAPTFSWSLDGGVANSKPDHFVVWENGFVVDTTENAVNNSSGTGETTLPYWLEKPTGKGVESITLPDLTGKTYIGLGRIVIEDTTGWGASAYAEFDFGTKTLTHVVVTSRGCNYSDNAKAYLVSPGGTAFYECALTLSDNTGRCGMFVKRGGPTLVLSSDASTIDGGYAVEGGTLQLGVIPNVAVPVRVESDATFNLNNKGRLTASTFTGAGSVTNGEVTVANAMRASCADIFAGKYATFSSNLTFKTGSTFTITDPENLETYAHSGSKVAFAASAVNGTPELAFDGEPPQGVKWALFKKSAGTYNFGPMCGTRIMLK